MADKLKILRWDTRGWAGVDYVSIINPSPHLIEFFSRENAEGKTSLLESLRGALGGAGAIGEGVIREGSSKAEVNLDLGTVTVRCSVSQKGRNLTVKTADKKSLPKAQTYLDGKVGRLIDPSAWREWDEKRQSSVIRDLAGSEWLARRLELELDEKTAYDTRHDLGVALSALGEVQEVPKAEPVDVSAVASELAKIEEHNREQERAHAAWHRDADAQRAVWQRRQDAASAAITNASKDRRRANDNAEKLRAALAEAERILNEKNKELSELPPPETTPPDTDPEPTVDTKDTSALHQQLEEANERNRAAAAWEKFCERRQAQEEAREAHRMADEGVEAVRAALVEHDRIATLPEGLTLSASGATYDGRPLSRMSTGECFALAFRIAVYLGQQILVLDNAEALGPSTVQQIQELAVKHDVQVVFGTRSAQPHTPGAYELRNGRLVTAEEVQ